MTNAIELKIRTKEAEVNLNMESVSQRDRTHLLNVLEGLLDVGPAIKFNSQGLTVKPDKPANKIVATSKPTLVDVDKIYELGSDEPKPLIGTSVPKVTVSSDTNPNPIKSRQLPLVNGDRSPMVSMAEKIQDAIAKSGEPEWYKTGIKIDDDGTKRYKCHFECDCGRKGNHYVEKGSEEVPCFDCDAPLRVRLATGQVNVHGVPERDAWGNYYIAENIIEED